LVRDSCKAQGSLQGGSLFYGMPRHCLLLLPFTARDKGVPRCGVIYECVTVLEQAAVEWRREYRGGAKVVVAGGENSSNHTDIVVLGEKS
jgi:hypothetical protein